MKKTYKDCKIKFLSKHARGLSVFTTYLIAILILIIIINFIFPVLKESITELIMGIPTYYENVVNQLSNLPEDSIFKSDVANTIIENIRNINVQQLLSLNYEKVLQYAQNILNVFSSIFDVFVSLVVSVYVLLQRKEIMSFFKQAG